MSNITGMDIAAVRMLAKQLRTRADEIRAITQQLTGQLQSTPWVGPDREQFYGDWTGRYTAALQNVVAGLENAATRAIVNSNEQEAASSR